jgi:hypothetical protein
MNDIVDVISFIQDNHQSKFKLIFLINKKYKLNILLFNSRRNFYLLKIVKHYEPQPIGMINKTSFNFSHYFNFVEMFSNSTSMKM